MLVRWPQLLVVGVVVFAAACSGSTSGGDPTSPTGDSPAASPSSPVATASVPGSSVAFDDVADASLTALSEEPVVGPEGTESFVNPGGVTYHDGQFHMLRNSFTGYPGPTTTTYLASEDGLVWEEQADEPVLETADVPFANEEDTVFVMSLQSGRFDNDMIG